MLPDPVLDVRWHDAATGIVEERLDLRFSQVEGIHQEEADVLVRQKDLVLGHFAHGSLPSIEKHPVCLLFLPSHMVGDLC